MTGGGGGGIIGGGPHIPALGQGIMGGGIKGGAAEQQDGAKAGAQVGLQPAGICGSAGIGGGSRPRQHASSQAGAHDNGQGGGHNLGNGFITPGGMFESSPIR